MKSINMLRKAFTKFLKTVLTLPIKQITIIATWLDKWAGLIVREKGFKPEFMPRYKRGDILYVDFGWNIGHEFGGVHYAAVLENDNPRSSGTILVIPLSSLDMGEQSNRNEVYLGNNVIPWADSLETVAKPKQIRAISKMRILKPTQNTHKQARLTCLQLDMIDDKVKQLILKPTPFVE